MPNGSTRWAGTLYGVMGRREGQRLTWCESGGAQKAPKLHTTTPAVVSEPGSGSESIPAEPGSGSESIPVVVWEPVSEPGSGSESIPAVVSEPGSGSKSIPVVVWEPGSQGGFGSESLTA